MLKLFESEAADQKFQCQTLLQSVAVIQTSLLVVVTAIQMELLTGLLRIDLTVLSINQTQVAQM